MPTSTAWPVVAAFGITLMLAGLVTNVAVSVVGTVAMLIGAVGWFRDVYPHPRHEPVPVLPPDQRAAPAKVSTRSVEHLRAGKAGHRVRVPVEVHPYWAGVIGGIAGGIVMAVLALAYGLFTQGSIWYPINLLAAAGVPTLAQASLETLREFSMTGLIVGSVIHGALSILIGLLYTLLLPMLPVRFAWFWGGIFTPLMWSALLYASMHALNPALAARIDWFWFIMCQVAYGLVAGFVIFKTQRVETMQTWPLAEKLGIEAQSREEEK